jgi:hypothetical protein
MSAARRRPPSNYVAEWFGHIVWPAEQVDASPEAVRDQTAERCPFLSSATATELLCIKRTKEDGVDIRTGFCTASSPSTGVREDWLACPWRVFDEPFTLIADAVRRLYGLAADESILVFPVTRFGSPAVREAVHALDDHAAESPRVFAFSSNPRALGGEIDVPETDRSPGNKVDVSIFEVLGTQAGGPSLGRSAIFEIQTADFHGSPLHAVRQLRRLGPPRGDAGYHRGIAANSVALGDRVEVPNKANIFKHTIYQMILKIQMAKDEGCMGFAVVLPEPVWRSWERHLGQPKLLTDQRNPDVFQLRAPADGDGDSVIEAEPAWILVFRVDRQSAESPKPLKVVKRIATDSAALIHYAFDAAPQAAIEEGAMATFAQTFRGRLMRHWGSERLSGIPDIVPPGAPGGGAPAA